MDEADNILIDLLMSIGLDVPDENSSLETFTPGLLINATGLCLDAIFESRGESQSFPKAQPVNMAARYRVGQLLSEAIKQIGYSESVGYQLFLYPNSRDTRRILSFLVSQLPKEATTETAATLGGGRGLLATVAARARENTSSVWLPHFCRSDTDTTPTAVNAARTVLAQGGRQRFGNVAEMTASVYGREQRLALLAGSSDGEDMTVRNESLARLRQRLEVRDRSGAVAVVVTTLDRASVPRVRKRTKFLGDKSLRDAEDGSSQEAAAVAAEESLANAEAAYAEAVVGLEQLLRSAAELHASVDQASGEASCLEEHAVGAKKRLQVKEKRDIVMQHGDTTIDKLQAAIDKRQKQLLSAEEQWNEHKNEVKEKIEQTKQEAGEKMWKSRGLEAQLLAVREAMEGCRRDYADKEGNIGILTDKVRQQLEGGAGRQSRHDYTRRILELTENKKKQDLEIQRILSSIFGLQREINSLRGKLDRSFVETRDSLRTGSNKDEQTRRMVGVVQGIHDSCARLVAVIEDRGRVLRELRELETALELEERSDTGQNLHRILADLDVAKQRCAALTTAIQPVS